MKKLIATALAVAAIIVGIGGSPASAAEHVLRPADVTHEDTRSAGHNVFLNEGVRVFTDDNSSNAKATGYYDVGIALDNLSGVSQDWAGTDPQPGMQLVVDDGMGNSGILVYEPVYGGDLWLTNGSSQALKDAAPSHTGGSGSENHGTLAEWQTATDLLVVRGGWSLGSGVKGSGVLVSQTYGDTTFTFTKANAPLPTEKPVASATIASLNPGKALVKVTGTQPAGTQPTPKGAYYRVLKTVKHAAADGEIKPGEITGSLAQGRVQGGAVDKMRFTFHKATRIAVVSYGHLLDYQPLNGQQRNYDRIGR